jgi:hypothetical protein
MFATSRLGLTAQDAAGDSGTLTAHILSLSGGPLPAGRLSVEDKTGKLLYAARVQGDTTLSLPFGDYVVTFESEFIKQVRRIVKVDKKDTFVVIATDMDDIVLDIPHDPVGVTIAVRPPPPCQPGNYLWARLVSVFSGWSMERKITPEGYALFEPVESGVYVVIVVEGKTVRSTQPILTNGPLTSVKVNLDKCQEN